MSLKRLPVGPEARRRFLRFTTPRTQKFPTSFGRVRTRFLLFVVYSGALLRLLAADEDELMRTFLLLCFRNGSHAPRGDTAPKEAIYQYAQDFQQLVRRVRCLLHPYVPHQTLKSIYNLIKYNILGLLHELNTFGCLYAPVGVRPVERMVTIILHNCNFTIFDSVFPLI